MAAEPYRIDPNEPRAPPQEVWERLTPEERARLVESLPLGERLRFFHGRAPLPESDEMIATLERMVREAEEHRSEEERLRTELEQRLAEESQRLAEESRLLAKESRLREEAERRLAEALAELERLRQGRN